LNTAALVLVILTQNNFLSRTKSVLFGKTVHSSFCKNPKKGGIFGRRHTFYVCPCLKRNGLDSKSSRFSPVCQFARNTRIRFTFNLERGQAESSSRDALINVLIIRTITRAVHHFVQKNEKKKIL